MPAETVRSTKVGKRELRLVRKDGRFFGLADGAICVEGADADDVWGRLHRESGKLDPRYFGYDGAKQRFTRLFPGGFGSEEFVRRERKDKLLQMERLKATAPLEEVGKGASLREPILRALGMSELLFSIEKMRVAELLRGPAGDAFVEAAARFTVDTSARSLAALGSVLEPHGCANWSVATFLPFLWRPEAHMILKPAATKDFAARVGHPLADVYRPRLDFDVYAALIDLTEATEAELVELAARDRIDVQGFIWVVGRYKDTDV
jgi:hypothetical protein